MKRLVIIGIDGLDRSYVADHLPSLPNISRVLNICADVKSISVFPPDSDTAWASIYTGINPAKHGVIEFVDPLSRVRINKKESEYLNQYDIKGRTFWDIAGRIGKRSCLIYPHLMYPAYNINGFMISPHPEGVDFSYSPSDYPFEFDLEEIKVVKRIPRTKLEFNRYFSIKMEAVQNEFNFASRMLDRESWDLFLLYSSALDSIMHIFWSFCDPEDPTYPGRNRFDGVILEMHRLYDSLLGTVVDRIDPDTSLLILSDHGHYRRPVHLVNINEILRKDNLLIPSLKNGSYGRFKHRIKRTLVDVAQRSGLRPAAQTILRMFPGIKESYIRPSNIDFNKTIAHCTDLSGLKAYSYGGIIIREENVGSLDKNVLLERIIARLKEVRNPDSGEFVFDWIRRREEVYNGPYLNKYPDILFNLKENYGAGWEIDVPLFSKSLSHKFYPGSHRGSTPVFYLINPPKPVRSHEIELMDIAPTILDILGIRWENFGFDGGSILEQSG